MNASVSIERNNWRAPKDETIQVVQPKALKKLKGEKGVTTYVDKELVGNNPSQRNWRGILIALLVILVVCSLIIIAVILVTPKTTEEKLGEKFTFEDFFDSDLKPKRLSAQWIGDSDKFVYRNKLGELIEYDAKLNTTSLVIDNSTFRQLNTDVYFMSEDLKYVLIAYDIQSVYRHSYTAKYKILSRYAKKQEEKLIDFPAMGDLKGHRLQYAGWSPKGHSLSFVYKNNLFYQPDPHRTFNQVTTESKEKFIFNGISDWVYEEEILGTNVAHWWSPDGQYICYAVFNDTKVPVYKFPFYGSGSNIYGNMEEIAYPKAGDPSPSVNPTFDLYVMNTRNTAGEKRKIPVPDDLKNKDHYFFAVSWRDNTHVAVVWSNRSQNKSIITIYDVTGTEPYTTNLIEEKKNGWVTIGGEDNVKDEHYMLDYLSTYKKEQDTLRFIRGGEYYLTILPEQDGTYGHFKHVAMVTAPGKVQGTKTFITQGLWDVTKIVGYDEEENKVYFLSTKVTSQSRGDSRKRHLWRVDAVHISEQGYRVPECLTCHLSEDCQYVYASFSKSAKYYILNCQGPAVPTYILKSTIDGRSIMLEENGEFRERISKKAIPKKEYHRVQLGEDMNGRPIETWAEIYIPPVLKTEHITKYPLILHTYGGPGSQRVTEQYKIGWATYMTSSENVLYASIDGRGSGGQGDAFMHAIYRNLGTLEVSDQLAAARYFSEKMHYVDTKKMSIWGWSYGGFVTSLALGRQDSLFQCGVAVAPVTDWRYYDTVYTERFMGLAHNDNSMGYDNANVSKQAANFKDKKFMIVHGTGDDNVHFQHSAQLMKSLTEAGIDFRVQIYPDKTHSLSESSTQRHLWNTMRSFFMSDCFQGRVPGKELAVSSSGSYVMGARWMMLAYNIALLIMIITLYKINQDNKAKAESANKAVA